MESLLDVLHQPGEAVFEALLSFSRTCCYRPFAISQLLYSELLEDLR